MLPYDSLFASLVFEREKVLTFYEFGYSFISDRSYHFIYCGKECNGLFLRLFSLFFARVYVTISICKKNVFRFFNDFWNSFPQCVEDKWSNPFISSISSDFNLCGRLGVLTVTSIEYIQSFLFIICMSFIFSIHLAFYRIICYGYIYIYILFFHRGDKLNIL